MRQKVLSFDMPTFTITNRSEGINFTGASFDRRVEVVLTNRALTV